MALLFAETLFGDKLLTQVDALLDFQPWKSVAEADYRPGNPLLLDQSVLVLPWLEFNRQSLERGELPLWNPDNFCGQPITAAYTGAFWWPLHWIYYAWPTWHYHAWAALVRLFAAGLFSLLFLRCLGLSRGAALVGATAFSLCGFLVAWLNHPHVNAALFLPLLFYAVERLVARARGREVALLAVSVGLTILGGHIQTAFQVLLFTGVYALFRALVPVAGRRLTGRGVAAFAGGALLGALLAMPQLLPFAEYLGQSQVLNLPQDFQPVAELESRSDAALYLVAPDHAGRPDRGDYVGQEGPNLNYNELVGGFVGRLALALALLQLVLGRRDRRTLFFGALVAVTLLVAWQVEPLYGLFRCLPVLENTKLMRFLLLAAFGLSVLAAQGTDSLLRLLGLEGRRAGAILATALFAVVALELVLWGRGYNPATEARHITPSSPAVEFLQAELRDRSPEPFRVVGHDNTIFLANANLFHGIPLISGYDYIENARTTELVAQTTHDERGQLFTKEIRLFNKPEALPLLSLLGVRYVLAEGDLSGLFGPPVQEHAGLAIYENAAVLPRAFAAEGLRLVPDAAERLERMGSASFEPRVVLLEEPIEGLERAGAGQVRLSAYGPRRVELEADFEEPGLAVLADAWFPGWSAAVDGQPVPIHRVDHALRGIVAPAGTSRIELRYDPWTARLGIATGAAALIAILILTLFGGPGRRVRAPEVDTGEGTRP